MKTIILEEPGAFQLTETNLPGQPGPGEALLRVRRVGICGTDLHAFRGRQPFFTYPRILGHELAVEILALGPAEAELGLKVRDICCVEPYLNCGHCIACRQGKTNCCASLQTLGVHTDGGMREQVILPANKLHLAKDAPLDQLAIVEMLCIGAHAVRRAAPGPEEWALVIGVGPIGLSTAQFAKIAGANVIAMDISEQRLDFCRRELGIEQTVNAAADPLPQLEKITGGDLPTLVFDATGNATSMMSAFNYVAHGGKLVFVGLVQDNITFHDPYFHSHELTILSSRNATAQDFAWVIENLQAAAINLSPWITHRASPEALVQEFPDWLRPETGVIKAMLAFD
jgi:2-desacetyl-2-hydroxyethyl bacteriochlorophyllide A dehydrogenase